MSDFQTVGFVGLGLMGKPMVGHLANKLPASTRIYVYDVLQGAIDELESHHQGKIIRAMNAKDVADKSVRQSTLYSRQAKLIFMLQDVIITMVPEGSHVKSVYLDDKTGIWCSNLESKLLIDCSTIDTATSLLVKDHIAQKFPNASFYDAPVSGGVVGAVKGTIAFFLGCSESDPNLQRISSLLSLMGGQIIPCGSPSLGLAAKLSNNYLSGIIAIACSEALDMGMRSGLDPRVLSKVYAAGTAQNAICDKFCPCPGVAPEAPSSKGYQGGFKVNQSMSSPSLIC